MQNASVGWIWAVTSDQGKCGQTENYADNLSEIQGNNPISCKALKTAYCAI